MHYGGMLIYLVLVGSACYVARWHEVVVLIIEAGLTRAVLFDTELNTSRSWFNHSEGRALVKTFEVGTSCRRPGHALARLNTEYAAQALAAAALGAVLVASWLSVVPILSTPFLSTQR
jgi:hypothetical protein